MISMKLAEIIAYINAMITCPYVTALECYTALIERGYMKTDFHDPEDLLISRWSRNRILNPKNQLALLIKHKFDMISDLLPMPRD